MPGSSITKRQSCSAPLLEARRLERRARDNTPLLHPTSLRLSSGDSIACQGRSGAGKTILLRALAALDPFEGHLVWQRGPVSPETIPSFRAKIIYVPQSATLSPGTVRSALQEPFSWQTHRDKTFDESRISAWLCALDRKPSLLQSWTQNLSGGELQIVALLKALQLEPTVLLLDEPTRAIDELGSRLVEALIRSWIQEGQRAVIWVTHSAKQVQRIAGRRITVEVGHVIEGN